MSRATAWAALAGLLVAAVLCAAPASAEAAPESAEHSAPTLTPVQREPAAGWRGAAAWQPPFAHAVADSADSTFDAYMRGLSDSTDAWFGATATPVDTAGLDSALAVGLSLPPGKRGRRANQRGFPIELAPAPGYNRADGFQLGASAAMGRWIPGAINGRAQYTTEMKDVIGDFGWEAGFRTSRRSRATVRAHVGRWTEVADRDSYDPVVTTMASLIFGGDRHQYLRRDGWRASARWTHDRVWAALAWRDQLESPMPMSIDWALIGHQELDTNFTAAYGRVRELGVSGEVPVPGTRFRVQAGHWTSSPELGSAFDYWRMLVAAGGDISVGRHFALVPQASYGRLHGEVLPQNPFFFGGAPNVRSLDRNEWSGAGRAFGRLDFMLVDEIDQLLRLPLPAWMPLQLSTFIASGAVWGRDPVTNQARPTERDWPTRSEWMSETGVTLAWRVGIPEPTSSMRFEYTFPIGPDERNGRYSVVYQQPLHLLRIR